jgi:sporulation protein YlmC with PRC-barrel domain
MRLSDLYGAQVRTAAGEKLGRVREVHCKDARVTQLAIGATTLLARMTGGREGRRIDWEDVHEFRNGELIVKA